MSDSLVKGSSSDLASKLEPTVSSLARPSSSSLLQARADIQRTPELQELFREAKEKDHPAEWLADNLAARLAGIWDGNLPDALEAARYLADEYQQIGEGILIVSSETGKAIAKLDEKDLYTPAPVLRESGQLAEPLPRIQPGLEGLIVSWVFEKGREERIETILRERANQTALLKEEGDRRLWIASRKGRARIAQAISEDHPKALLGCSGGTTGAFLGHFDMRLEPPDGIALPFRLEARTTLRIHDPTTTNLQYDRLNSMRGVLAQGWVRELGRQLSQEAHRQRSPRVIAVDHLTKSDLQDSELWIVDPVLMSAFLKITSVPVMPVIDSRSSGFRGKVGAIVVPDTFELHNREIFGRWETVGILQVQVYIQDWDLIQTLEVSGVAPHVEVLKLH